MNDGIKKGVVDENAINLPLPFVNYLFVTYSVEGARFTYGFNFEGRAPVTFGGFHCSLRSMIAFRDLLTNTINSMTPTEEKKKEMN